MEIKTRLPEFIIRQATAPDVPLILSFIKGLGEYEKLSHEVVATEELPEPKPKKKKNKKWESKRN